MHYFMKPIYVTITQKTPIKKSNFSFLTRDLSRYIKLSIRWHIIDVTIDFQSFGKGFHKIFVQNLKKSWTKVYLTNLHSLRVDLGSPKTDK